MANPVIARPPIVQTKPPKLVTKSWPLPLSREGASRHRNRSAVAGGAVPGRHR
jgi:hypothetical protein